jgi:hypothetical protein
VIEQNVRLNPHFCHPARELNAVSLNDATEKPICPTRTQEPPTSGQRCVIGEMESIMKTKEEWRRHLNDAVNASMDPMVYSVHWARDPRCIQAGKSHRRVGLSATSVSVCRLWSAVGARGWY